MFGIDQKLKEVEALMEKALQPRYDLQIIIRPDDGSATKDLVLIDDDGNNRCYIGKLNNDYGVWISRRGYDVTNVPNPKFYSFTGSLLTPRLKYQGIVTADFEYNVGALNTYSKVITIPKDSPDERIILTGFQKKIISLNYFFNQKVCNLFNLSGWIAHQGLPEPGGPELTSDNDFDYFTFIFFPTSYPHIF